MVVFLNLFHLLSKGYNDGGPVVKTLLSNARAVGSVPGQGTGIPPCCRVRPEIKNK